MAEQEKIEFEKEIRQKILMERRAAKAEWRRNHNAQKSKRRRKVVRRMETNYNAPFQPIKNVTRLTGFSERFVRNGVKPGMIPHVRVGVKILVDVPKFLVKLQEQSGKGDTNEQEQNKRYILYCLRNGV